MASIVYSLMEEIDKLDRYRTTYQMFIKLRSEAGKDDQISMDEMEKLLDRDLDGKLGSYEEFDWDEPVGRERW